MLKPFHFILQFIAGNPGASYSAIMEALCNHRGVPYKVQRTRWNYKTRQVDPTPHAVSSGWYTWYFSTSRPVKSGFGFQDHTSADWNSMGINPMSPLKKMGADYGYYEKMDRGYHITSLGLTKLNAYNQKLAGKTAGAE
jgi:hypothetical protein